MKIKFTACLVAAFVAVSLSGAFAADKPFSFTVEGNTLHIFAPDGKEIGTGLPPATIAKTVEMPPYSFQVSFGSDANGNLSVIVTPNPENPTPLNFTVNNRSVQMDKSSVVTITVGNNGATTVDPGANGGVKVDNHTSLAAAGPTPAAAAAANAAPPAPTIQQSPAPAGTTQSNPSNLSTLGDSLADPTAAPVGLPATPSFNANGQVVLQANNPQTSPAPTTPF